MSNNLFFFSNQCEGSKVLIGMLNQEDITKNFQLLCVDKMNNVPAFIKTTPALVIKGIVYEGNNAFTWYSKMKQWKVATQMKKYNEAHQKIYNNLADNKMDDLLGYSESEMGLKTDIFSFFNENLDQECQQPLPQNYLNFNSLGNYEIITPMLKGKSWSATGGAERMSDRENKKLVAETVEARRQQDMEFEHKMTTLRSQFMNLR